MKRSSRYARVRKLEHPLTIELAGITITYSSRISHWGLRVPAREVCTINFLEFLPSVRKLFSSVPRSTLPAAGAHTEKCNHWTNREGPNKGVRHDAPTVPVCHV